MSFNIFCSQMCLISRGALAKTRWLSPNETMRASRRESANDHVTPSFRHLAYLYHPVALAKMALQIENISRGRLAINLVNAWNRPELEKAGIGFPEHDARYAYGREWISVVSRLMQGERVTYKGAHFDVRDYALRPKDLYRPRPM